MTYVGIGMHWIIEIFSLTLDSELCKCVSNPNTIIALEMSMARGIRLH